MKIVNLLTSIKAIQVSDWAMLIAIIAGNWAVTANVHMCYRVFIAGDMGALYWDMLVDGTSFWLAMAFAQSIIFCLWLFATDIVTRSEVRRWLMS